MKEWCITQQMTASSGHDKTEQKSTTIHKYVDDYQTSFESMYVYCYEPGVTRKKWKWNQQQVFNY